MKHTFTSGAKQDILSYSSLFVSLPGGFTVHQGYEGKVKKAEKSL
jgi:hypothetical protein